MVTRMDHDAVLTTLDRFSECRVLVFGDVMLDRYVYGSVERISPEAPIPVMAVEREVDMPGGAANVARNVASMGARAILIGIVGNDVWASDLLAQLALLPTIDHRLITDHARPTTRKTRFVADRQQLIRADREQRSVLSDIVAERVLATYRQALADADVVILSDYAKGVLSDAVTKTAIEAARRAGKPVIVDPKSRSLDKYVGATLLTPNRQELELACGHPCRTDEQVVSGTREILEQGVCDSLVVTRGAQGMTVMSANGSATHLPATAREVFDVSGAGDTVVAALSLALAAHSSLVVAAAIANAAAGLVVAKLGTAVVSTGEIAAALTRYDGRSDHGKLFGLEHVTQQVRSWRAQGLKVAFANGCFDLLHTGHLSLLEQARRAADRLVVGLNSDLSVRRLKGEGRPVQSEVTRATILSSLKAVDAVVIFPEETPLYLIETLLPDVLVKGADYSVETVIGADIVLAHGGRIILSDLVSGQSTSGILARVAAFTVS
jgi:D-beta-D-heptose 7-phosphate kinase / D-beta-D-heptose 1-phosphate adenosyltransferase